MGSGVPDEVIRIRWVAEFHDRARGLTSATRRQLAELQRTGREQRKINEENARAGREQALIARRNARALDYLHDRLTRLQKLEKAEPILRGKAKKELAELRLHYDNLGIAADRLREKRERLLKLDRAEAILRPKQREELRRLREEFARASDDIGAFAIETRRLTFDQEKFGDRVQRTTREQREMRREARRLAREMGLEGKAVREAGREHGANAKALALYRREAEKARKATTDLESSKRREIGAMRENRNAARENATAMGRFARMVSGAGSALRFSTNEMILWGRTTRLLMAPAVITFLGIFVQLLSATVAAATALVSALRPLVGLMAALPALGVAAAQGMLVWNLATTKLGKSSTDLGKIIETSLIANTEDFRDMLEDLPRRATGFARFIRQEIRPGFLELRADVQDNIFDGLERGLRRATPALRPLRNEFVQTSEIIGGFFAQLGRRVGRGDWAADLEEQARRTNRWMRDLRPVALDVADGLRHITLAAEPLVDNLVELASRGASWFQQFAQSGRASGRFAGFFRETNFVLEETLSLIGSFGSALNNILGVGYETIGRRLLVDLRSASQSFRDWTESAAGRNTIADYFREMRGPIYEVARLVRDITKGLFSLGRQPGIEQLIRQVRTELGPAFGKAVSQITRTFGPVFVDFLVELTQLMTVLAGSSGPLTAIVEAFTDLARIFRQLLTEFPLISKVFLEIVAAVTILRGIRFIAAISGIGMLIRMVGSLAAGLRVAWGEAAILNRTMAAAPLTAAGPAIAGAALPGVATAGIGAGRGGAAARLGFLGRARGVLGQAGRFAVSPTGAGVLGIGATIGGLLLGGRGGAALAGGGIGLQAGAMFGPWGAAIGTAVGALGGFTAAVLLAKSGVGEMAKGFANLGGAAERLGQARESRGRTLQDVERAQLDVRGARLSVRGAREFRQGLLRGTGGDEAAERRVKRSTEYKQALLNEQYAVQALEDAELRLAEARDADAKAQEEVIDRQGKFARRIMESNQAAKDRLKTIEEETSQRKRGVTVEEQAAERQRRSAEVIRSYRQNMLKLAEDMRSQGRPQLAEYAQTAADLAAQIRGIPSKKDIDIVVETKRLFTGAGARRAWDIIEGNRTQFGATVNVTYRTTNSPPPGVSMGVHRAEQRTGGRIIGPRNRDSVPILAAGGEAILTGGGQKMVDRFAGPGVMDWILEHQPPHFSGGGIVQSFQGGGRVPPRRNVGARTAFDPLPTRWEIDLEGILFGNKRQIENAMKSLAKGIRTASISMIEKIEDRISRQIKRLQRGSESKEEREQIKRLQLARRRAVAAGFSRFGRQLVVPGFQQERGELRFRRLELQQQLSGTFESGGAERAAFIRNTLVPALQRQVQILARQFEYAQRTGDAKRRREAELALEQKKIELLEAQLAAQEASNSLLGQLAAPFTFEFGGQRWTDLIRTGEGI